MLIYEHLMKKSILKIILNNGEQLQQFGFISNDDKGILRITPSGESILKENGLV